MHVLLLYLKVSLSVQVWHKCNFGTRKRDLSGVLEKKTKTSEPDRKRKSNLRKERVSFLAKMEKDSKKTFISFSLQFQKQVLKN